MTFSLHVRKPIPATPEMSDGNTWPALETSDRKGIRVFLNPSLYWAVWASLTAGLKSESSRAICNGDEASALYKAFLEVRTDKRCKLKRLIEFKL